MPRRGHDDSNLPPSVKDWVDSLSPDQLQQLLPAILSIGAGEVMQQAYAPRPSRLRPPSDEVVTCRVRVDLQDVKPPVWRRVDLASDMTLDVLHRVLQVVMGWTDSHLHGFSSGGGLYDRDAERYLTEYDLAEGDEGVAEADVRLDQVLQDVGDRLSYEYDFGDSWTHRIVLEAVEPRQDGVPLALCVTGRRACPPEDVGGVGGYEELLDALAGKLDDDEHVNHLLTWAGPHFDPDQFSVDEVNERLRFALVGAEPGTPLPETLASMLRRANQGGRPLLEELVARARLDDDTTVSVDVAEQMVAPYAWFMRRIGTEGVKLTPAGYLPPAVVVDVAAELDLEREWIGTNNREHHTIPVLLFRESAQALGLVKKRSGRLSVTAAGRKLVDDPLALWRHIASRLPLAKGDAERDAGVVYLLTVAAEEPLGWHPDHAVAAVLASLGWRSGPNRVSSAQAYGLSASTGDVLYRMGAVVEQHRRTDDVATPEGRILARVALRSL